MNDANPNLKNRNDVKVTVRIGNEEWVVGQVPVSVEKQCPDRVLSRSLLEENRKAAKCRIQEQRIVPITGRVMPQSSESSTVFSVLKKFLQATFSSRIQKTAQVVVSITGQSSIRESFRGGILFGMVLGCASLLLFHQLDNPSRTNMNFSKSISVVSPPIMARTITAPGLRGFALSVGNFETEHEAIVRKQRFAAQGIQTAVMRVHGYQLVNRITLQEEDLQQMVRTIGLKQARISIVPIAIPPKQYPVFPTTSDADIRKVTAWLSSEVSALIALQAWAADGGRQEDASKSYQNAAGIYPSDTVISSTGLSAPLGQLRQIVNTAYSAFLEGNKQKTETAVVNGYQILLNWQNLEIQP